LFREVVLVLLQKAELTRNPAEYDPTGPHSKELHHNATNIEDFSDILRIARSPGTPYFAAMKQIPPCQMIRELGEDVLEEELTRFC
jgi:hypothetical protein